MKIFSRLNLATVALILFFNASTVIEASAQGALNEILKRMDAHQKSLSSLRSNVTMQQHNSYLNETDTTQGTAIYFRSNGNQTAFRIDWTKPVQETLAVVNGQYVLYRPHINQAIVGKIGKSKTIDALSFLTMSKSQIKANYTIMYVGTEKVQQTNTWHLIVKPKKADIYKSTELWIDTNGMPIQTKVLENNTDTTTVLLSGFKKNETIKVVDFKVNVPKGTKFIKDSAGACPCFKPDNAKEALKDFSDAVFSGKVIAVNGANYTVITERMWKGVVGKEEIVRDFPIENSCPTKLTIGEKYVLFARKKSVEGKSIMALMPCNLSSSLNSANGKKILKEIGKGKPVKKAVVPQKRTPVKLSRKRRG